MSYSAVSQLQFSKASTTRIFQALIIALFFLASALPARAAQISLEWEPGDTNLQLAGYKVYYGTISGNYPYVLDIGKFTSCDISGLMEGKRYYFSATSYDNMGHESDKSGEISHVAGTKTPDEDKKRRIVATIRIINTLLLDN